MNDTEYMRLAIELAKQGCGWTSPNPMVGAVIVKDGKIIGQGWHVKHGQLHAERHALKNCTASPKGATMYVTLEPCCHYGSQPPCTDAILEAGIAKVVVGANDPNPLVAGKGLEILRSHGVEVVTDFLAEECEAINQVFFHFIRTQMPYVVMKYAMTIDGKIATYTGESKWITGEEARKRVHHDRHRYSAIMVGIGTVIADDPMLNCRIDGGKNPIRIICDTSLRIDINSQIVRTAHDIPTIIATSCEDRARWKLYEQTGCQVWHISQKDGHLDLKELIVRLGQAKIDSVLLEGGSTLNWAALEAGIVQKVQAYIAPKLFGGSAAKTPIAGIGIAHPDKAIQLSNINISIIGEDILVESEVTDNIYRNS